MTLRLRHPLRGGEPPRAGHRLGHLHDQRLVRLAPGAVALQCLGQRRDAGAGRPQRFVAARGLHALEPSARKQLELERVVAGPAGRTVDLAQAPSVRRIQRENDPE